MKNKNKQNSQKIWKWDRGVKQNLSLFITRIKQLQGDPHYIAMGMGAGVFVCSTPTFPFQTFLAIALAFILRGSKAAAAIGSWIAAPGIPFFYLGSYKVGTFLLGSSVSIGLEPKSISDLLNMGLGVASAMLTGGIIVGLVPGIAAYFITYNIFKKIRSKNRDKTAL